MLFDVIQPFPTFPEAIFLALRDLDAQVSSPGPHLSVPVSASRRASCNEGGIAMEEGATVPLTVVGSRTEADLIVGLLRSYGLRAAVAADDVGGQEPHLQLQGVRVLVAPADEASARQLLAAAEQDGSDGPPIGS
ncbi:DUF2007 domain-containing protein [Micromonospora cremea]|uniref:DUF2007 domain-containing protein n=1 Tax=Micromonospora cremea TaxID=709881 RepID=UPI001430C046|nr:DUF2007 domain-containing protein [Micromonospora cremea]